MIHEGNHYIATNRGECSGGNGAECLRKPINGYFFIRVGSIDNTANLRLKVAQGQVSSKDNMKTQKFKLPIQDENIPQFIFQETREYIIADGMTYVDAQVKDIKIYSKSLITSCAKITF